MILAVDSSALALLINPAANPPNDPTTGAPVVRARERVEFFLGSLRSSDTLVIPTPVLAEALVKAEDGAPGLLGTLTGMARVKVKPFGERAAVETALMTRSAVEAGNKKLGSAAPWQKVKVDRQIVAVARVEGAAAIYADDKDLVAFALGLGMEVMSTWTLPLPETEENLFTTVGLAPDGQADPPAQFVDIRKDGDPVPE